MGQIKHGTNLEITYFDQHRATLNPEHSLMRTLCPGGGDQVFLKNRTMHVAAYLKNFMFDPKQINDKVGSLSGGQAGRLLLAKSLINPGNLLILDEPTNDLDMDSLEVLLEILAEYDGTLFVVSHDRDFLERLVTRTLVFTEDKHIIDQYGGFEDYIKYFNDQQSTKIANKNSTTQIQPSANIQPKKLSYKYARRLEILPNEIEQINKEIKQLEDELMDPDLYLRDPTRFDQINIQINTLKSEEESKTEDWIEAIAMSEELNKN